METLFQNQQHLRDHIRSRLRSQANGDFSTGMTPGDETTAAAILLLLGMHRPGEDKAPEPSLIFNQRSRLVRQPGDLCFPGGGFSPRLDRLLAGLLGLPGFPLHSWHRKNRQHLPRGVSRFLATSLREGFEEMRVNPFHVKFLGPMAPEHFKRFNRTVYPMVAWHTGPNSFSTNWEVERIVFIPLRRFFDPGAYTRLPLSQLSSQKGRTEPPPETEFPCLIHENGGNQEIIWGLTFRIVLRFLEIVFDFKPPETPRVPITKKTA